MLIDGLFGAASNKGHSDGYTRKRNVLLLGTHAQGPVHANWPARHQEAREAESQDFYPLMPGVASDTETCTPFVNCAWNLAGWLSIRIMMEFR